MTVDEILGGATQDDLAGDADSRILLEPYRRFLGVPVVKDNRDAGLCDSCLAALVYQVLRASATTWARASVWRPYLKILRSNRRHVGDAENKTYRVEDIGLATAVEAGDGVETLVPGHVSGVKNRGKQGAGWLALPA